MLPALSAIPTGMLTANLTSEIVVPVVTTLAIVVALLLVGITLLFRNREGAQPSSLSGFGALRTKAGVLLVRLDDAIAAADNELGFAVAQFGEARTASFSAALAQAHAKLTQAFRIRQELDDAVPEPPLKARELTLQIIALCEAAEQEISGQDRDFAALRSAELNAPTTIKGLRARIAGSAQRLAAATTTLARLSEQYEKDIDKRNAPNLASAKDALDAASAAVDRVEKAVSPAGVNAVVGDLTAAEDAERTATLVLDSIDALAARFDTAASALDSLVATTRSDLVEARKQRDAAPDPATGAAIVDAIALVESVLAGIAAAKSPANPVTALDSLGEAVAQLDTALASARNQAERLDHARTALVGTLVNAKSQISTVRAFITVGAGRVGPDARTRLAEAERQLMLAENEADPVVALDTARRAVTCARDADDLAHYDAMTGR